MTGQADSGKARLYVGCSLSHASEQFKLNVEALKVALRQQGYDVFDFVGLVKGTARDVYEWDLGHCIAECDAFIAICDEPSTGLGYELCRAVALGKPVLALAHVDAKITRMLLGAAEVEPNLRFERYQDLTTDVPAMVAQLELRGV